MLGTQKSVCRLIGAATIAAALYAAPAQALDNPMAAVGLANFNPLGDFLNIFREPATKRKLIAWSGDQPGGTVVVSTSERKLNYVLGDGTAIQYGVGVGREGFTWSGTKKVTMVREWPGWTPPSQMLKRRPDLPRYMPGGIDNPLGARAIYLGSSLYRIHGSNEPETIGAAVSSGCIRMTNEDVTDLAARVKVGTKVVVLK
ncbi:ErfK/YbiS/YcfS/YnhG family protein [Methylocella silvestris BL2]|uniref:ErfK/YbiS/YcfS/YnhG family protein n=1 Tax=Methylocella silvestris (strain DSM 15510 / CIP 108128 / LMG 27833 / NCIMB 13906 / BL2) TaxID=395965 RepID=B8EIA3_METSB|nr:ErfK/YbiS/YcfS/YnhG family protein [Methylocella silvestris BL2]